MESQVALLPSKPKFRFRGRFKSLRSIGIALEYFPRYVSRTLKPHTVDVVLLSFILRGEGRHVMGDDQYHETGGSLGITHYGQRHDIITSTQGMEIMNIYLDLENHALPSLPGKASQVPSSTIRFAISFCSSSGSSRMS